MSDSPATAPLDDQEKAPDRLLRMSGLATDCKLSLSGMTRIVTRQETDGLVERVTCTQDARDSNGVLTDTRLARLQQAYPTHLASVRLHVIDYWQGIDLAQFSEALDPITC